jgi:hypothetical protein
MLQEKFAAMLDARDSVGAAPGDADLIASGAPVPVPARVAVYRNNTRVFFRNALERSFPVLQRRVGDEAFGQLASAYRDAHPSRRGDLHWVGLEFPGWLAARFAGTEYEWLSDLARLEWACQEAMAAAALLPLRVEALASVPADRFEQLKFAFQPALRLVASRWPVWSVWQVNQDPAAARTVDLDRGAERCAVSCADDRAVVYRLEPDDYALLGLLLAGQPLGEAVSAPDIDASRLQSVLGWAFSEGQVTGFA